MRFRAFIFVAWAIGCFSPLPVKAVDSGEDLCAPVPGSSMWTVEEINRNEYFRSYLKRQSGTSPTEPALGPFNSQKYANCRRNVYMTDAVIVHELIESYGAAQGTRDSFALLSGGSIDLLLSRGAGKPGGPLVSGIGAAIGSGLSEFLFGEPPDTELGSSLRRSLIAFQQQRPGRTFADALDDLLSQVRAIQPPLDRATLRFAEQEARWQAVKLGQQRPGTPAPKATSTQSAASEVKQAVTTINRRVNELQKRAKEIQSNATALAPRIKELDVDGRRSDWVALASVYSDAVAVLGESAVASALATAPDASNPLIARGMQPHQFKALSARQSAMKAAMENAQRSEKIKNDAATLATAANNFGWTEGARVFAAVAGSAGAAQSAFAALQGTATSPPGPLQYLAAANAMFTMGAALQGAFGGGGGSGEAEAKAFQSMLRELFAALRAIQQQLAEIQKEQREQFQFLGRNLNVLVQLAHVSAMGGMNACNSVWRQHQAWSVAADSLSLMSMREFLYGESRATGASQGAAACVKWLWEADRRPITADHQISPIYQSAVAVTGEAAAQLADASDTQFRERYDHVVKNYASLRALAFAEPALAVGGIREFWWKRPGAVSEIGIRAAQFGQIDGKERTYRALSTRHINVAAAIQSAEAAMLLHPVIDLINLDNIAGEERDPIDALKGKQNEAHYARLVELHSLLLAATAAEALQAGAGIAQRVDLVLDEADLVEREDEYHVCLGLAVHEQSACLRKLPPLQGTLGPSCPLVVDDKATRLCHRMGRAGFSALSNHARIAVRFYPTLRQNVLSARLWRVAGRDGRNRVAMPSYRFALAMSPDRKVAESEDATVEILSRMFPGVSVRKLGDTQIANGLTDEYIRSGVYFARLSGRCDGLHDKALLLRASCANAACDLAIVDRSDGKGKELALASGGAAPASPADDAASACVMASVPDADDFEAGRALTTETLDAVRRTTDRLARLLAYEYTFRSRNLSTVQKWRVVTQYRPSLQQGF